MNLMKNIKYSRRNVIFLRSFVVLSFIATVSYYLLASSGGITGYTNNGCNCHGFSTSTSLSATSQSGSFTVQPGSTSTFTITVSNSSYNYFGIDLAVKTTSNGSTNAGTLSPASGSGLRASNGELTQSQSKYGVGSASFTFTWTAPNTTGTYYLKAAGNAVNNNGSSSGDNYNLMAVQSIIVSAASNVALSSPNGGENICAGSSSNITWTSSGINNVSIDLSTDGGSTFPSQLVASTSASAGSWAWNIPSNQTVGNQYKIRISDASNADVNSVSAANFSVAAVTAITTQPQPLTVCSNQPSQFAVAASGNNLSYKWQLNGVDISGANSSTLTIPNTLASNSGNYSCIVTGTCSSVTSNSALLTVNTTPTISQQPLSVSLCSGEAASFSVTAAGADIAYQWRKNSQNINGATTNTYTIGSISESDAGNYDCVVSGKCSPVATSTTAILSINTPPSITVQPKSDVYCEGSKAIIFVKATGTELSYTWAKDGVDLSGINNDTLTITKINKSDAGNYSVKITGKCGPSAKSNTASVLVNPIPVIIEQPASSIVTEGSQVVLTAKGDASVTGYQWRKNGINLNGMTGSTLTFAAAKLSDAGNYDNVISNTCGSITSNVAKLTVGSAGGGPNLALSSNIVDFKNVIFKTSKDTIITGEIINSGTSALTITAITITGTNKSDFLVSGITLPLILNPNETKGLSLQFTPTASGTETASIQFSSDSKTTESIDLTGFGALVKLTSSVHELKISSSKVNSSGTSNLSLKNDGNIDISGTISLSGADASMFKINQSLNYQISAGSSMDVSISYTPLSTGQSSANLNITINEDNSTTNIPLQGEVATSVIDGINIIDNIQIYPNPAGENVNISISTSEINDYELKIYNLTGDLIKDFGIININGGNSNIIWNKSDNSGKLVPDGNYRLIVKCKDMIHSYPIIINQ